MTDTLFGRHDCEAPEEEEGFVLRRDLYFWGSCSFLPSLLLHVCLVQSCHCLSILLIAESNTSTIYSELCFIRSDKQGTLDKH